MQVQVLHLWHKVLNKPGRQVPGVRYVAMAEPLSAKQNHCLTDNSQA